MSINFIFKIACCGLFCFAVLHSPGLFGGELPFLDPDAKNYRTPLAGEGFYTTVFGEKVTVSPRERRHITGWDFGLAAVLSEMEDSKYLPFGSVYVWRRPHEQFFLRGVFVGVYNELVAAWSKKSWGPFELAVNFENFTIPASQAEFIDGTRQNNGDLHWGWIRPGAGIGYRLNFQNPEKFPLETDNMFEAALFFEPGYYYYGPSDTTHEQFKAPSSTYDLRGHARVRYDNLRRNIMELAHQGAALGADFFWSHRTDWRDWGLHSEESAKDTDRYFGVSGYGWLAGKVPFLDAERHRLIGSLHGGYGRHMDRFSIFRVGGGPNGEEYYSAARPILPGAFIQELLTDRYLVLLTEYRWEPLFFSYAGLRSSLSYLRRKRDENGKVEMRADLLPSMGARVTTGFFFDTRLQVDYNYNWGVIRKGTFGGHEMTAHLSSEF